MSNIPEHVKNSVKNTIGYHEAENKRDFNTGASIAFTRAEEHFSTLIDHLNKEIQRLKLEAAGYGDELKTIANILNKYSE